MLSVAQKTQITRKLEFDAGHRLPWHNSQCRHIHGHRYSLEITLNGVVDNSHGTTQSGMIMDFSLIKSIAQEHLVELWDHAFLTFEGDTEVLSFLNSLPDHKTVVLPFVPTAENLAQEAFRILSPLYKSQFSNQLNLYKIRLYETPNNWADVFEAPD